MTQRVSTGWLARRGLPHRDVKGITDSEVKAIYEADYWRPPRCDQLPMRLDLVQFDTAVNMGVRRAVRFLQGALDCEVDGQFGPATTFGFAEPVSPAEAGVAMKIPDLGEDSSFDL